MLLSFILVIGLICQAFAAPSMMGLRVVGKNIVNKDGQIVRLAGVNRSGMEFACVQTGGLSDGPMDQNSVNAMKSWNINAVRIPLNEDCWLAINGVGSQASGNNYINAVKQYVDLLTTNGLAVILDLHWTAAGSSQAINQQQMPDSDHALTFWTGVASTFKSYSNVIFDLFNEPFPLGNTWNSNDAWNCWLNGGSVCGLNYPVAGMQSLLNSVRATGATNIVIANGIAYSNSLAQWLSYKPTDPLNQMAAGTHLYNFNQCNSVGCFNQYIAPIAQNHPVIIGEMGENDCGSSYIETVMDWADSQGTSVSYMAWTWNAWDCASGPALISDFSGTPTGFGAGYKARLARLAATLGSYTATGSVSTTSTVSSTTATTSTTGVAKPASTTASTTSSTTSTTGAAKPASTTSSTTSTTGAAKPASTTSSTTSTTGAPKPASTTSTSSTASTTSTTSTTGRPATTTTTTSSSSSSSSAGTTSHCSVTVTQTVVSTWASGSTQQGQVSIAVSNPNNTPVTGVTLHFSTSPDMSSAWNLNALSGSANSYTLPSWTYPLRNGSPFTSAGYIYSGSVPSIGVTVSC